MGSSPMGTTMAISEGTFGYVVPGSMKPVVQAQSDVPHAAINIKINTLRIRVWYNMPFDLYHIRVSDSGGKQSEYVIASSIIAKAQNPVDVIQESMRGLLLQLWEGQPYSLNFIESEAKALTKSIFNSEKQNWNIGNLNPSVHSGGLQTTFSQTTEPSFANKVVQAVEDMPGAGEYVKHPVLGETLRLHTVIMNLNDAHGWTREEIADWLDTLDIDLSFKVDSTEEVENVGHTN